MKDNAEQVKPEQAKPDTHLQEKTTFDLELEAKNELYTVRVTRKSSISDIASNVDGIITELSKSKLFSAKVVKYDEPPKPHENQASGQENPIRLFAEKIGVNADPFEALKLIAIKNDDIQLLKPTKLKPTESCYLLLAVSEFVFRKPSISYDEWRELCQGSNIKSGMPFYKIANNAKSYGHIDKKKYDNSKEITLTPRGVEVVKKALEKTLKEDSD